MSKPCPICGKPADPTHKPFCSSRCKLLDLGAWLGGRYVVPGEPADVADSVPGERE